MLLKRNKSNSRYALFLMSLLLLSDHYNVLYKINLQYKITNSYLLINVTARSRSFRRFLFTKEINTL